MSKKLIMRERELDTSKPYISTNKRYTATTRTQTIVADIMITSHKLNNYRISVEVWYVRRFLKGCLTKNLKKSKKSQADQI